MTGSGAAAAVDETARPATTALTRPRSHLRMKAILPIPRTALPRRAVNGHTTGSPTRRGEGETALPAAGCDATSIDHPLRPLPSDRRPRRVAQLFAGLCLYGLTAAMLVLAGLGLDPWDVLHQGLARTFGLGIGTWAIFVSFAVLLAWWPLRQRPGFGTLANALVVGAV